MMIKLESPENETRICRIIYALQLRSAPAGYVISATLQLHNSAAAKPTSLSHLPITNKIHNWLWAVGELNLSWSSLIPLWPLLGFVVRISFQIVASCYGYWWWSACYIQPAQPFQMCERICSQPYHEWAQAFEGESHGAISSALTTVSRKSMYVKFLIVMQRMRGRVDPYSANFM